MGKHGEVYRGYVTLHKIVHFYDGSRTVTSRALPEISPHLGSCHVLHVFEAIAVVSSINCFLPDRLVCVCSSLPFVTVYAPIIYRMPTRPGVIVIVVKKRRTVLASRLALSLLVSRVGLADNVQVSVMSLASLSSNNLENPKFRTKDSLINQSIFKPTLQCSHLFLTEL